MNGDDSFDLQPCSGGEAVNDGQAGDNGQSCNGDVVELSSSSARVVLHRLTAVCREKKIARRVLAQRLGVSMQELRQEAESDNLSIGTLSRWALALGVPVTELIVEPKGEFAPTSMAPTQAARLMAVATRLRQRTRRRSVQRLRKRSSTSWPRSCLPWSNLSNILLPASEVPRDALVARALRPLPDDIFLRRREPGER